MARDTDTPVHEEGSHYINKEAVEAAQEVYADEIVSRRQQIETLQAQKSGVTPVRKRPPLLKTTGTLFNFLRKHHGHIEHSIYEELTFYLKGKSGYQVYAETSVDSLTRRNIYITFEDVKLGSGKGGVVYKATVISFNGEKVSYGTCSLKKSHHTENDSGLIAEGEVLSYIDKQEKLCPSRIVPLHKLDVSGASIKESDETVYMLASTLMKGSLEDLMDELIVNDDTRLYYAIEILKIYQSLSNSEMIHGDIATRNILVDFKGKLYLSDFGKASIRKKECSYLTLSVEQESKVSPNKNNVSGLRFHGLTQSFSLEDHEKPISADFLTHTKSRYSRQSNIHQIKLTLLELYGLRQVEDYYPSNMLQLAGFTQSEIDRLIMSDPSFFERKENGAYRINPKYKHDVFLEILKCKGEEGIIQMYVNYLEKQKQVQIHTEIKSLLLLSCYNEDKWVAYHHNVSIQSQIGYMKRHIFPFDVAVKNVVNSYQSVDAASPDMSVGRHTVYKK